MRNRVIGTFFLAGMLCVARPAMADDPRREEAAREMSEGMKLAEQHDEAGALAKFEAAFRAYPSPNALYNIAREKQLLKRDLEAVKAYRECRKSPLLDPKFATLADQFIAELERTTARIQVQAPAGSVVSIDGTQVDASAPVDVAPGSHTVTASALGKTSTQRVDASVGQTTGVTMTIESGDGRTTEPPKTEERTEMFPPPTGAIVLGGIGLVGLGLGVGFGLASSAKRSDYENRNCALVGDATCNDLHDSSHSQATISVLGYVGGGLLVAGGLVWWLAAPRKETVSVSVAPMTDRGMGGLQLRGAF